MPLPLPASALPQRRHSFLFHCRCCCFALLPTILRAAPSCLPRSVADGTAWGVLLLNSNGQEVVAVDDWLTFRAIGGVMDLVRFVRV